MASDPSKKRSLEHDLVTMKRSCLESISSAESYNLTAIKIKIEKPSPTMKSLSKNERDNVPMTENELNILSRLCQYSNNTTVEKNHNTSSARLRESYASVADSVKKNLISSLTSGNNLDFDYMIDMANAAFASLIIFQADFAVLYDAVRDYILYHYKLSEANKELRSNESQEEMISYLNNLSVWLTEAATKLISTSSELTKAKADDAALVTQILETRELLKELEEKLVKKDKEIDSLQDEFHKVVDTYLALC